MSVRIVPMTEKHIAGAVALQRVCFPEPFPEGLLWRAEHLRRHLERFPEGQFVALRGLDVVASASLARISEERWHRHAGWDETVGGPFMDHFDPAGSTLYGMDISVAPEARGQGIGRRLYETRFQLVKELDCVRYGTACRLPGYAVWSRQNPGTVHEYGAAVADGSTTDPTLTPLLRYGLSVLQVLEDYMEDEESGNAAALLEWTP